MKKLIEAVFREELQKLKQLNCKISENSIVIHSVSHTPTDYTPGMIKSLSEDEISKLGREGWDRTYAVRESIEKSIDRLELVLNSLVESSTK